jgi:hypothetical protein
VFTGCASGGLQAAVRQDEIGHGSGVVGERRKGNDKDGCDPQADAPEAVDLGAITRRTGLTRVLGLAVCQVEADAQQGKRGDQEIRPQRLEESRGTDNRKTPKSEHDG